jgi:hypothetical protein
MAVYAHDYIIADAIAAAINGATFSGTITTLTATVEEDPTYENMDDPTDTSARVSVCVPEEMEIDVGESRAGDRFEFVIKVILTKRLANDGERRTLAELRWQLYERLRLDQDATGALLAGVPTYWNLKGIEAVNAFSREGIRGPKVLSAGIALLFSSVLSRKVFP